jgi:hypothetical protein
MQEHFRRRRLPHWDVPRATYFITACLADSIPARGLLDLETYRSQLASRKPPAGTSPREWQRQLWKLNFARVDYWLDSEPAARHLQNADAAQVVRETLYHFASERYNFLAL